MFSAPERAILKALAEAALPPGRLLAGAGEGTLARLEAQLSSLPAGTAPAYRAGLWSLELGAVATTGGRFSTLPLGRRLAALEALERVEATRLLVRGLVSLLKLAWLDDPALFAALGCRYAVEPPLKEEKARWKEQVSDGAALAGGEALECDVVVVGTGAGGAPAAMALAERGLAVLLLEEGPLFTRKDFDGRPMQAMRKMYKKAGLTASVGNHVIPIPIGRGVGGTTLINSGTCFRVPDKTLAHWREEGLTEFTPSLLAPYYEQVEKFLEVGPSSTRALGKPATLIARGCDALGYAHHALARNAPGCDGQGLCCFGCPTEAKRSTNVSYVPAALDKGAQLLTGVKVEKVLVEGGRAVGVEADASGKRLQVRARAVVLACGALATPVLLQRQGLGGRSGQVGKNLSIHPAAAAIGVFEERVDGWNTVPQGYAIDEFKDEGLYFEGASAPLELAALAHTGYGPSWVALMEEFPRSLMFGFMVKDTSRGTVRPRGADDALITYWLNRHDVEQVRRGLSILSRVYFAAGAREVHLPIPGSKPLRSVDEVARFERAPLAARQVDLTAYHPLGTCRMGVDPAHSVVDRTHQVHEVPGLYLCDGSVMPSSLGVNPQLTIMAMALKAAEHIAGQCKT